MINIRTWDLELAIAITNAFYRPSSDRYLAELAGWFTRAHAFLELSNASLYD